ncbi:uncharacterized protein LOC144121676 [Amblyomma americanum]
MATAEAEYRRGSTAFSGSGGFSKEIGSLVADGSLNCVAVIQLRENDYLLPTAVLCEASPAIRNAMSTQRGDTIPRIHIKGIDDKTFAVIMEYLRAGDAPVNVQNVIDVYHAATSLQIKPLETICWNRVFEKEPLERSLPAWIAAKKLNMPDEEKQLFRFITHNFEDIAKTDSFYELDATQLKEILRADVIRAEDELSLYKALMNWIHYDCKARSKYASSLVEAIRFHDMTPGQVEGFKAFKICPEVQKCFDVSQRIPQPGQKKSDKGREYAQLHKVEAGEAGEPTLVTGAGQAVPPMPSAAAVIPPSVHDAVARQPMASAEPAVVGRESIPVVHAAQPPPPPPPQQQQPTAPVVLSLEQQANLIPPKPDEMPEVKPDIKKEASKDKAAAEKEKQEPKGEKKADKAAESRKDPSKEVKVGPVSEPSLAPKELPKTKDGKRRSSHEKKKSESHEKPDAKGDKKDKKDKKAKEKHKGKYDIEASKSAPSDGAMSPTTMPPSTVPATMSDPTSGTTLPASTTGSAASKDKRKQGKDKKSKDKKTKSKDKKGKAEKGKKKKKGFCPWLSSKSKSTKSSKSAKGKGKGKSKSKESASKDTASRSEAKTTEASKGGKSKGKKDKKGGSKEASSRSKSKEKAGKEKSSKEKAGKGSKEKADKGSKEKSSKEKASKEKHSKEKHSKEKHASKEKHSKDKRSKEKLTKDKASMSQGKKGSGKDKGKKKKHSKEKKSGESKSESAGGGGTSRTRESRSSSAKAKKPSVEGVGGGGGKTKSSSKQSTSKSRRSDHSSKKSHSGSSRGKSSGKSSKTSSAPKRRPEKDKNRSDLGVRTKRSGSGGGAAHRRTRSANRLSSGPRGSDLSLVGGKSTFRTDREMRRRRLSKVPHRARSETPHTSDVSTKGFEHIAADQQLVVAVLGGLAADSKGANLESAAIFSFWPQENKWKCAGRMPKPRYGHQAVIHGEYIYVVGGFEVYNDARQLATASCHRFSLSRSSWESMGSLRHARCHHGVAVVLGKIYAVGGQSEQNEFMDSVEVYDPAGDRWSEVTPLCCARMAASAVEFRNQMYVVGGLMVVPGHKRKVCIVPDTMCFDPMDDTWHHKASLPIPVCNCSLVAHRGRLLAVGGLVRTPAETSSQQQPLAPIGDVLEYSPANDSWTRLSVMPTRAHSVGLASLGDDIYILGGQLADDAGAATRNAYRYNLATDRWVTLPPLPMRLSQACAVTVRKHTFK